MTMSALLAELYEDHAVGCVEAAARTDDPKHREMLLKADARVDEGGSRITSIDAIEASVNLQNLSRDEWALP